MFINKIIGALWILKVFNNMACYIFVNNFIVSEVAALNMKCEILR